MKPHVSICIVHYGKIDDFGEKAAGANPPKRGKLLRQLITSIETFTDYPAEVLVWDNGGNEEDTNFLMEKVRTGTINTLIRSKENMNFAFGWNALARIATGDILAFLCNDIEVAKGWLSSCVDILEKHKGEKCFATPFITYDKVKRGNFGNDQWGNRINGRAGSNCMVIRKEDFYTIGEWPLHRIGGSIWFTKMFRMGYRAIAPPEDLALDAGWRAGTNFTIPIEVKRKLLDGTEIHLEEKQ